MHPTSPTPCANRIPRVAPSRRVLVNLNDDDEPTGPVTAADLIRTIQARDAQQWQRQPLHIVFASGAVDALPLTDDRRFWAVPMDQPPMPAECATELGANAIDTRAARTWLFERWMARWPRLSNWLLVMAILLLLGLADNSDTWPPGAGEEIADAQAAAEVQP